MDEPRKVLQLSKEVKDELVNCFQGDTTYVKKLLTALALPPLYSSLRVNTKQVCMEKALNDVKHHFSEECKNKGISDFVIYSHPSTSDCIIIENRGPKRLAKEKREIIVSLPCGMSVLRGANVYAQGIVGCPKGMKSGDKVSVYADLDGKCLKGFARNYEGQKLFLGNGEAKLGRTDLFNKTGGTNGVGVSMTAPVYEAPVLSGLPWPWLSCHNLPSLAAAHCLAPPPPHRHAPAGGERILDMCAAPGGKTAHLASLLSSKNTIVALEKSSSRAAKLAASMAQQGFENVKCFHFDATQAVSAKSVSLCCPPFPPACFDRVLVDAPCSALGQRPCVVNNISLNQLRSFPVLQYKILTTAFELLKPGGLLVYSTCTIMPAENEGMVAKLLAKYPDLELIEPPLRLAGPGRQGAGLPHPLTLKVQRFDPSPVAEEAQAWGDSEAHELLTQSVPSTSGCADNIQANSLDIDFSDMQNKPLNKYLLSTHDCKSSSQTQAESISVKKAKINTDTIGFFIAVFQKKI